jgi:hypothetical protein
LLLGMPHWINLLLPSVILGGLVAALAIHLSLWFLWAAVPDGAIRLAFSHPSNLSSFIDKYVLPALPLDLSLPREAIKRSAVSISDGNTIIAVEPRHAFSPFAQRRLTEALKRRGWQVRRLGLVVIAANSEQALSRAPRGIRQLTATLRRAAGQALNPGDMNRPLAIMTAQAGSIPWYDQPFSAVAIEADNEIEIRYAGRGASVIAADYPAPPFPPENQLTAVLPGIIINDLPEQLKNGWNTLIISRLHLEQSQPDIFKAAAQHNNILVSIQGDQAVIAVQGGKGKFINGFIESIKAEEAYRRPERRAFRLPDGTIGYEMIAGQEQEITPPAAGACTAAGALILCAGEKTAAVGTEETITRAALAPAGWHIRVGARYLHEAALPLHAVVAAGDGKTAVIRVQLAQ